jgi:hypothetical protein
MPIRKQGSATGSVTAVESTVPEGDGGRIVLTASARPGRWEAADEDALESENRDDAGDGLR